jgi:Skp family chaperone for outer membrane proteins
VNDVVIKKRWTKSRRQEEQAMRTVKRLVGKVGFTAVGVAMGITLAAGGAAAAVHVTGTMASGHAINVVQSNSSVDRSVGKEDSRVSGAVDKVSLDKVLEPKEALEPDKSSKHIDDSASKQVDDSASKQVDDSALKTRDDSASKTTSRDDSAPSRQTVVATKPIEPSDMHDQ